MDKEQCFYLGKLLKTHGLKGEISVFFDVDYPEQYQELELIYIQTKTGLIAKEIEGIYFFEKKTIIKFKEIDRIEAAQPLLGAELYLPLDFLPEPEDGGFYFHDVIGFEVIDQKLGKLGRVIDFYEGGAQDLMEMEYKGHRVLIPVHDDIVISADMENKTIQTALPDGLLEVYLENEKTSHTDPIITDYE